MICAVVAPDGALGSHAEHTGIPGPVIRAEIRGTTL